MVAGCSRDGDGGENGEENGEDEENGGDNGEEESTGGASSGPFTATSPVEGLTIQNAVEDTGDYSGGGQEGWFGLELTVLNSGGQTTDIFDYGYNMTVYDAQDNDVTGPGSSKSATGGTEIAPGETATISVLTQPEGGAEVVRAEAMLNCDGMFVEGTYCGS